MGKKTKLWNIDLKWYESEAPRLEISLLHYVKDDAIYFIYIQLYKLVFCVSFDIDEQHKRRTGYYDMRG